MSAPARERAIVDAGLKAFAFDSGPPLVYGARGLEYAKASDEHGVLARRRPPRRRPSIGDRLWLIPGHCDPTVNLYDWIVGVRGTRVECVWPIAARGALALRAGFDARSERRRCRAACASSRRAARRGRR